MRGFLRLLALSTVALATLSQNAKAEETFLDRCFPNTTFLKTKIECGLADESGELKFTLTQGKTISVVGTGRYGTMNKSFKVGKITHLPPRLSDVGALDESVRFLGMSFIGGYIVTIDIPCNQTLYGTVGLSKKRSTDEDEFPSEHIAACSVL